MVNWKWFDVKDKLPVDGYACLVVDESGTPYFACHYKKRWKWRKERKNILGWQGFNHYTGNIHPDSLWAKSIVVKYWTYPRSKK